VHGDEGAVVGVRWRGRRGGEADFEPENAFVGGVAEFVFVEDFKGGWGGAGGESVLVEELVFGAGGSGPTGLGGRGPRGGGLLLDVVGWFLHICDFGEDHCYWGEVCWGAVGSEVGIFKVGF